MNTAEFRMMMRLDDAALADLLQHGWLRPRGDEGPRRYSDIDMARAQLIADLRERMQVNDDGIDVILDLVDQLHGLHRMSRSFGAATRLQPAQVRRKLRADARRLGTVMQRRSHSLR
jgi:chaperone modulatory protein CbpM